MKIVKDYMVKLGFVFKEIFKAGPSVFFLSVSSMVIAGISPVLITYLTAELIERLGQNIGNDSKDVYVKVIGAFVIMFLLVVISYENVTKINLKDMFNQNQEDYYVYFYMVQCPFCNQVKDKMLNFAAENDNVYFVDYALRENRPLQKYNWAATRSKYNKKIGYVDSDGNKVFLPGESEEKYQNMKNDYGKRMRFNFVTITPEDIPAFPGSQVGDIYTDIQTPEIDYASITKYEDMLIAGVPALYRITNGKITEFYFDSVEIEEFFNSMGR